MRFVPHHIGDYRKDTTHLSLLEHGIYRQLLDTYYLDEQPLSSDLAKLMRSHSVRTPDEQQALQDVLSDFFILTDKGFTHIRCDQEIERFYAKSESARASANARWSRRNKESDANALQTDSESNAKAMLPKTQDPLPNIKTITPIGFDLFWNAYDKKIGKPNAIKQWLKIKPSEELLQTIISKALADCAAKPDTKFRKDPERWLKGNHWEDEVIVSMPLEAKELPLGSDQQIETAYRIECGGDPRMSRFGSYFEMKKFVIDHREKHRVGV